MGSKKYPDENSFDQFIQKSGGFDNASTDCETTVFFFEAQRRFLKEGMKHRNAVYLISQRLHIFFQGLDRFAQFFISPLMKRESMEREREAVDSEFEMALTSDTNRKLQIFGELAKDKHPMGKFMWGNLKSLQQVLPIIHSRILMTLSKT